MALHVTTGTGAPTGVPVSAGEHYIDITTGDHYISNGIESADNWIKMMVVTGYVRVSSGGRIQVLNESTGTWLSVRGRNDSDGDPEIYASIY